MRLFTYVLICLAVVNCYGQKNYKTNLEIFDSIITAGFENVLYHPEVDRNIGFVFVIHQNDSIKSDNGKKLSNNQVSRYLKNIIKKVANSEKIIFGFVNDESEIKMDSIYNLCILTPFIMSTKYNGFAKNKFLGEKTINRNIIVKISVNTSSSDGKIKFNNFIQSNYRDDVDLDNYEYIESSEYGFARSDPPEISEFESIVFPALLVLLSAGATVLFFIIRTK